MSRITEADLRHMGLEGIIYNLMPAINEQLDYRDSEITRLTKELEHERIKNTEQIKIIEAMVRGLRS